MKKHNHDVAIQFCLKKEIFPLHSFYPNSPITQSRQLWLCCQAPFREKHAFLFFYPAGLLLSLVLKACFSVSLASLQTWTTETRDLVDFSKAGGVDGGVWTVGTVEGDKGYWAGNVSRCAGSPVRSVVPMERLPFSNVTSQHSTIADINLFQG